MTAGVPVGTKLGRYEVVKHLARGGMADLCIARASGIENFERHVVIKHLRPEQSQDAAFVQMFVTEARLAGSLHHHNIVQVYDIGQQDGCHFFAMEYVHGEDLRRLLSKLCELRDHCPLQHVITIASAVAAALHHAHEQKGSDRKPLNIVHRDVTPANIIVGYDGNIKVVDFGIAKAAMRTSDTAVGMLKGKVPYMAPEQCTGKPVDRRSDVFALGIVLYELVTVRRLFKGGNEFFTMTAVVQGEIPKPSLHRKDMPLELEEIILKALARKPQDRYQTADELRLALDQFADKHNLRTSTTALADYMKKLFGQRPEPWADDKPAKVEPTMQVDFDRTDVGLAAIPSEAIENNAIPKSIATTRGSLIEQARLNAISSKLEPTPKPGALNNGPAIKPVPRPTPVPSLKAAAPVDLIKKGKEEEIKTEPAGKKMGLADTPLISPAVVRASSHEDTKPDEKKDPAVWMRVSGDSELAAGQIADTRAATDIDVENTSVSAPPPPPETRQSKVIIAAGVSAERENTELVTPLPVAAAGDFTTVTRSTRKVDKRWLFAGGIAATALVVAIIIMATGRSVADQAKDKPVDLTSQPPPPPPTPDPGEPDQQAKAAEGDVKPPPVENTDKDKTADTTADKTDNKAGDKTDDNAGDKTDDKADTTAAKTDDKAGDKTDPVATTGDKATADKAVTRGRNTTSSRSSTRTGSKSSGTGSKSSGRGTGTKTTTTTTTTTTPDWDPNSLMPNWKKPRK